MSDPSTLDAIAELAECPDGATITEAIVAVGYIDDEGQGNVGFATLGDAEVTTYLGLLAWMQTSIVIEHTSNGDTE